MLRPPNVADLDALGSLLEVRERADRMAHRHWRRLVLEQWHGAGFDPRTHAVLALAGGDRVVGCAALFDEGGFACVDPAREGEGIGSELLGWLEDRARADGRDRHRQLIGAANSRATALLTAAGYRQVRTYSQMTLDLDERGPAPAGPDGIVFGHPDPAKQAAELHALDDAAFSANPDYHSHSLERFRDGHLAAADFDPGLSLTARRDGVLVGMTLCRRWPGKAGLVDILAVAPAEQRRGLGRALLLATFAGFADAGLRRAVLDVASDNPRALALYEQAGMVEAHRADVLEKPIDR